MRSIHVSEVIARTPDDVYEYARDATRLPEWASGLAVGVVEGDADGLVVDSPMGRVRVAYLERNPYGVLDHLVELPDGTEVLNPMRVVGHPDGAEVLFTVRQLGMTDEQFETDVAAVAADLVTLKQVLETPDVITSGSYSDQM